jgi:hypothetical protein
MLRGLFAAGLLALVAALTTIGVATARTNAVPTLRGTVGPGFTINLTKDGKKVSRLKAGTYKFVIDDRSASHNFELERTGGAAKRELSSVGFTGTRTFTIKLGNGRWKYYCDPHEPMMRGFFAVGSAASNAPVAATTTTDDKGGHGEPEPGDDKGGR